MRYLVPQKLVYSAPRILEVAPFTFDFFETVQCGLINTETQIKAIDVLAYFILDELGMGDYSDFSAFISMIPKDSSYLPFSWSKEQLNAFDPDTRKLIESDLDEFNDFVERITLYHSVINEHLRWTKQELQWAFMTIQTRFELFAKLVELIRAQGQLN